MASKLTNFQWLASQVATTTIDVTLGFRPSFVLAWTTGGTSAVDTVVRGSIGVTMGIGKSDTDRRSMSYASVDAQATAFLLIFQSATAFLSTPTVTGTDGGSLDIDALANWPADGIRFIVDTQIGADQRFHILAFTGIEQVSTFQFQEPASTGAQAVAHGLGTTPTGVLLMSVGTTSAPPAGSAGQAMISLGMGDAAARQWVVFNGGDDANTTMDTRSYGLSGEIIALAPEPAVTLNARASLTSFDATNVNLNWAARAATRYVFGATWSGVFRADSFVTRTDTTPFNGPTCGFIPQGVLAASCCRVASTANTPTDHAQLSIGAATSVTERAAKAALDEDAVGTSECTVGVEYDELYLNISTASAMQGLMDVNTWADPISFVMDDADPTANFVGLGIWGQEATSRPRPVMVRQAVNRAGTF